MFNFNLLGWIDITAAILLYFTVSPIPEPVAHAHSIFLFLKGFIGFIDFGANPPSILLPIYLLGGAADILSAAILLTGTPPIMADYKNIIAGLLFLKGLWTFSSFMSM